MSIQLLNPQKGKTETTHGIAQNIQQMQGIIAQEFATIPIFVLGEVKLNPTFFCYSFNNISLRDEVYCIPFALGTIAHRVI